MGKWLCTLALTLIQNNRLMKNKSFVLQHHTAKAGFTALPGQSWCVRVCRHACVEVCIFVCEWQTVCGIFLFEFSDYRKISDIPNEVFVQEKRNLKD